MEGLGIKWEGGREEGTEGTRKGREGKGREGREEGRKEGKGEIEEWMDGRKAAGSERRRDGEGRKGAKKGGRGKRERGNGGREKRRKEKERHERMDGWMEGRQAGWQGRTKKEVCVSLLRSLYYIVFSSLLH